MGNQSSAVHSTNSLAIASLVSSILGWVFFLGMFCLIFGIVPAISVATLGAGLVLYCIVLPASCISPIAWLAGVITGRIALNQIKETDEEGNALAQAGFYSGGAGLGLMGLAVCILVIFFVFSGSLPFLSQWSQ